MNLDQLRAIAGIEINTIQQRNYTTVKEDINVARVLSFWVVVDPNKDSELVDICWETTPEDFVKRLILDSTQTEDYIIQNYNNVDFYGKKKDAYADAENRLSERDRRYGTKHRRVEPEELTGEFESKRQRGRKIMEDEPEQVKFAVTTPTPVPQPSTTGTAPQQAQQPQADSSQPQQIQFAIGQKVNHQGQEWTVALPSFGGKIGLIPCENEATEIKLVAPSEITIPEEKPEENADGTKSVDVVNNQPNVQDVTGMNANAGMSAVSMGMECDLSNINNKDLIADKVPQSKLKQNKEKVKKGTKTTQSGSEKKEFNVKAPFNANESAQINEVTYYQNEEEKSVNVPQNVKTLLKNKIAELRKHAEKVRPRDDWTANFEEDMARAFEVILGHLEWGTMKGLQMAQIDTTKLMGPMIQQMPNEVYKYITTGGMTRSLMDLYKEVKASKEQ